MHLVRRRLAHRYEYPRFRFVRDTSPKANARYFELLRQAGPARRLEICLGLARATRELAIAGIKQAHPDRLLSDHELRRMLAQRLYGAEVARRVLSGLDRTARQGDG